MTRASIKSNNILFEMDYTGNATIIFRYKGSSQGLITIDPYEQKGSSNIYNLYKWFDEGYFPEFFDTVRIDGRDRLRVIGVDEI